MIGDDEMDELACGDTQLVLGRHDEAGLSGRA